MNYYDKNGVEIREGDTVLSDGKTWKVMMSANGYLGIDSTKKKLIEQGLAAEGEYGLYPIWSFEADELEVIERSETNDIPCNA